MCTPTYPVSHYSYVTIQLLKCSYQSYHSHVCSHFFSVADFNYVSRMSCCILNECCVLHEKGHTNKNPTGISRLEKEILQWDSFPSSLLYSYSYFLRETFPKLNKTKERKKLRKKERKSQRKKVTKKENIIVS